MLERHTWRSTLALLSIVAAYALLVQGGGANQNASYALVKALAAGTAIVDETRYQVGDVGTPDVAWFDGHYYSAKAPGLAFATLPAYLALRTAGMRTSGDPTNMLWALGLLGTVLPVAVTLFLIRAVTERIEPGFGTISAATIGLGTLLLPFGTMFASSTHSRRCLALRHSSCSGTSDAVGNVWRLLPGQEPSRAWRSRPSIRLGLSP